MEDVLAVYTRPRDPDRLLVCLPHPEIFQALSPGVQLLLDDGKVRLEVQTCGPRQARTKILVGGALSDRKGVSVVGAVLPLSALTTKNRVDLSYALELGVDWVALSFVQRPEDVEEIRGIVAGRAGFACEGSHIIDRFNCRNLDRMNAPGDEHFSMREADVSFHLKNAKKLTDISAKEEDFVKDMTISTNLLILDGRKYVFFTAPFKNTFVQDMS